MKVSIDREACTGCGLCADNVPEVFEMQGDTANVVRESVEGPLTDKVENAASDCPTEAIKVE